MSPFLVDENYRHRPGAEWQGSHCDERLEPDGVRKGHAADVADHEWIEDSAEAIARAFSKAHLIELLANLGCREGTNVDMRCALRQSRGRHEAIPGRRLRWM